MNKLLIATLAWFAAAPAMAQTEKLEIHPMSPQAGKEVEIIQHGAFSTGSKIRVINYAGYTWKIDTLNLIKQNDVYIGHFTLPTNSAFTALEAINTNRNQVTNSTSCYFFPLNKKGKKQAGANIAYISYRMPSIAGGLNKVNMGNPIPTDSLLLLWNEEQKIKGNQPAAYFSAYVGLQRIILGKDFQNQLPTLLNPVWVKKELLSEENLSQLHLLYKYEAKDSIKAKQVEQFIKQQFPHGNFVKQAAFQQTMSGKTAAELIQKSEQFLKEYPPSTSPECKSSQKYMYYTVYRNLGTAYFDTGNFEKFNQLPAMVDFQTANEISRWNLFRAYTFRTKPLELIKNCSEIYLRELIKKQNDHSYEGEGFATVAEASKNASNQLDDRIDLHINILFDLNQYDSALSYFAFMSDSGRYERAELNEKHMKMLIATKAESKILPLLERTARMNALTPDMVSELKKIYAQKNGGLKGFEQYFTSLKSPEELEALKAYVKEHMVNQEYIPFALEDQNGKLVRSSDWDGKIVVVDFWATWCKPCIAAFPGMQMLVDAYAKDPKVDIYFIGTMQSGDYKAKSENFLKQEGYRFKLLHDAINDQNGGQQDLVFKSFVPFFKSQAIPRKVILKDGIMRFTSEGYSGSPTKLFDELSMAIELLKNEKN